MGDMRLGKRVGAWGDWRCMKTISGVYRAFIGVLLKVLG